LRSGDWKLHRYDKNKSRNVVVEQELGKVRVPNFQLFNLADDPAEQNNILGEHPDVAQRMKDQLRQIIASGRTREVLNATTAD
jgi:arylsulfatase A